MAGTDAELPVLTVRVGGCVFGNTYFHLFRSFHIDWAPEENARRQGKEKKSSERKTGRIRKTA